MSGRCRLCDRAVVDERRPRRCRVCGGWCCHEDAKKLCQVQDDEVRPVNWKLHTTNPDDPALPWCCEDCFVYRPLKPKVLPSCPIVVRRTHLLCTVCGEVIPVEPGDGTPLDTFMRALEQERSRHPARKHQRPYGQIDPHNTGALRYVRRYAERSR